MNIGFLSLGFAVVLGIVCLICMVYDTIPHEETRASQTSFDYSKLNPLEL